MIRQAKFGDIPRMADVIADAHGRSRYRTLTLDHKATRAILMQSIQRHGAPGTAGTLTLVAERDGRVEGLLIGVLDRVYHLAVELMATDLFFLVSTRADPRDAGRLLDHFIAWAKDRPGVAEVHMGATDVIGPYRRVEKLYRRKGLTQCGVIYRRTFQP